MSSPTELNCSELMSSSSLSWFRYSMLPGSLNSKVSKEYTGIAAKFGVVQPFQSSWKHTITDGSILGLSLICSAQPNLFKGSKGLIENAELISNSCMSFIFFGD